MRYNTCLSICPILFCMVLLSYCKESPGESIKNPVNTDSLINQIIGEDSLKQIDTSHILYEFGNGEEYVNAEIIQRRKDPFEIDSVVDQNAEKERELRIPGHYNNISVENVLYDILRLSGYMFITEKEFYKEFRPFNCKADFVTLRELMRLLTKQNNFSFRISYSQKSIIIERKGGRTHLSVRDGDTIRVKRDDSNRFYIKVPNETRLLFTLDDNKKVWLNAGTTITFLGIPNGTRWIRLKGDAYFQVEGKNDPLAIETPERQKIVIKTGNLAINTFSDTLKYNAGINGGQAYFYEADGKNESKFEGYKCITFGNPIQLFQRINCDPTEISNWTKGFITKDLTLTDNSFFEAIGRWYNIPIVLSKQSGNYSINAHIPFQSRFKNLLEILKFNNINYTWKLDKDNKLQLMLL